MMSTMMLSVHANPECDTWLAQGECDKNPGYMAHHCHTECEKAAAQDLVDAKELKGIDSFFDLTAKDLQGKDIAFSQFKGKVTIVVNVASHCGYTDSHYKGLVELWGHVKKGEKVNILAFPCNQFGGQEPGSNEDIAEFVKGHGVEFTMMDKIDVNGPETSIVYKYLKHQAKTSIIGWNFATYFVVAPDGKSVEAHNGVEPISLKETAAKLLGGEL